MDEADPASQKFGPMTDSKTAEDFERRHHRAQRRFLDAVKALELVRKMALPRRRPMAGIPAGASGGDAFCARARPANTRQETASAAANRPPRGRRV
jgi:hypothetical protein